jgi:hypothetical protein
MHTTIETSSVSTNRPRIANMWPIVFLALQSLNAIPASGAVHHIQQLVQGTEQVLGISTIDTAWTSFVSDGEASQAPTFDDDCTLAIEVAEMLELAGLPQSTCNSAVHITGLLHKACIDDAQCQHPFVSIEEKNNGLQTESSGHKASHACLLASLLLEPKGSVLGATDDDYRSHIQVNWQVSA